VTPPLKLAALPVDEASLQAFIKLLKEWAFAKGKLLLASKFGLTFPEEKPDSVKAFMAQLGAAGLAKIKDSAVAEMKKVLSPGFSDIQQGLKLLFDNLIRPVMHEANKALSAIGQICGDQLNNKSPLKKMSSPQKLMAIEITTAFGFLLVSGGVSVTGMLTPMMGLEMDICTSKDTSKSTMSRLTAAMAGGLSLKLEVNLQVNVKVKIPWVTSVEASAVAVLIDMSLDSYLSLKLLGKDNPENSTPNNGYVTLVHRPMRFELRVILKLFGYTKLFTLYSWASSAGDRPTTLLTYDMDKPTTPPITATPTINNPNLLKDYQPCARSKEGGFDRWQCESGYCAPLPKGGDNKGPVDCNTAWGTYATDHAFISKGASFTAVAENANRCTKSSLINVCRVREGYPEHHRCQPTEDDEKEGFVIRNDCAKDLACQMVKFTPWDTTKKKQRFGYPVSTTFTCQEKKAKNTLVPRFDTNECTDGSCSGKLYCTDKGDACSSVKDAKSDVEHKFQDFANIYCKSGRCRKVTKINGLLTKNKVDVYGCECKCTAEGEVDPTEKVLQKSSSEEKVKR